MLSVYRLVFLLLGCSMRYSHSATSSHHRPLLTSTDSILDIINTQAVERLIAERRQNESRSPPLVRNDLDDLPELEDPNLDDELFAARQEIAAYKGHKLLKSSKNALLVTRKEYLKKDWCKTEPLVQRVRMEGCQPRTVINRFCYGQCNSFYIPRNPRRGRRGRKIVDDYSGSEDEDVDSGTAFKSCAFCKPKKFTWITVTLRCPQLTPPMRKKRVQRIKQCRCIAEQVNWEMLL